MRSFLLIFVLFFFANITKAEMLRNDSIGNDPGKEKICAARTKEKTVPFEIDSRYIERARAINPDVTFVATDAGSPQLVECYLRQGTGKYEPASFSPEQAYWHLIRPGQFKPGINTVQGRNMAGDACIEAAQQKINRSNLDHSIYSNIIEIASTGPHYRSGVSFAGKKAERYDIVVEGNSFYRSSGPDLTTVKFVCLFSPMLEVKGVEFK